MHRRMHMSVASLLIELMTIVTILSCLFTAFGAYAQENPSKQGQAKIRTLFLAANPLGTDRLQLDEEIRAITGKIRSAEYRDVMELISAWAVRPDDLLQLLNQHKPQIVHFSGHGSSWGEIVLVDDKTGAPKPVSTTAMRALFRTLKDNIRLVVLNACYSRAQARAIVENIDCAVGMSTSIGDQAAITFAASFYRALGFGRSVQQAFEQGKLALLLEGIPGDKIPDLLCRAGIDASKIFLVAHENGPKVEPMTIKTIAGKYELKEESSQTSEFFRGLIKEELWLTADPGNPTQGTYILLHTSLGREVWIEDTRTGERHLIKKAGAKESTKEKGTLRLSGSTLKFECKEYTDTDGKSTYDRWTYSKDISVSLDNRRILIMRDKSGLVETWERIY